MMARKSPHFRTRHAKRQIGQRIYQQVYRDAPNPFLLMTPEFEILDANDAYLAATLRKRETLSGLDMFEAFPDNPRHKEANGVANLRVSLAAARSSGARQVMPTQRYDIVDPHGNWMLRYWRPVNWPVLDDKGSVLAIVHHVTNITPHVLAQQVQSDYVLFKRAEAACEESRLLQDKVRRQLDWAARRLRTRK